ncbi:hypothetical protein FR932_06360 [Moritella marina ATCC 15381]|uniref:Uncharacterized protein n=1 Tax=Moritella marina ATCC 15381 TaxID=1202962 RepID=A0A5J6WJU2_MORMI|nr:DUF6677 family protein [Moritella marina]QFI37481.1 hypothetical protein FR932_06360 [Moritella marina ATCC 15381]
MNNVVKAALLAAFLFPGAAHWWLKKYLVGAIFAILAVVPLYVIMDTTMTQTQLIIDKVLQSGGQIDLLSIHALVTQQMASLDTQDVYHATVMLLCVWLVNVLDAMRLARKREH